MESDHQVQTMPADYLEKQQSCPHCGDRLTFKEIIEMMHGSGFQHFVWIKHRETGKEDVMEVGLVNPRLVEIVAE